MKRLLLTTAALGLAAGAAQADELKLGLATAQTGQIGFIDGIPVFISAEMPLTMADGKINTQTGTNDRGTAVCVYRPGWFVGYRRKIAVNVDYIPYYDSYQMTATVRIAFANFDTDVASALYNIAV